MTRIKRLTGLHIENVQSISNLALRLDGDGFYWVKGKSNIGKSALLKSIKALFTNVSNNKYKDLIRDEEDYFKVTGYFEDDWVTLSRGSHDYYEWEIDGQYGREDKTNGKVPKELRDYFNLYWTGDKIKRYINFTLVNESLFFSETTSGDNTLIVEKAIGTDRLSLVSKNVNERIKDINREKRPYKSLIESELESKEEVTSKLLKMRARVEALQKVEDTLKREMEEYLKITELLEKMEAQVKVGKGVLQLKDQVDFSIEELDRGYARIQKIGELINKSEQVDDLTNRVRELERGTVTDGDLRELDEISLQIGKIDALIKKEDEFARLEKKVKGAEEELRELMKQEEDLLGGLEVCPLCEQPMQGHQH